MTLVTQGLRTCEPACMLKMRKTETCYDHYFVVKLVPQFFDAKLIICLTFCDKPAGFMQVIGFKISPPIGY
jgi:hypothetical protein